MKKLFKKPDWLKPEVNEFNYWLHLLIIVFIIFYLFSRFIVSIEINVTNVLLGITILAVGDIIAHTVLRLD